jgi:hypothetical protein
VLGQCPRVDGAEEKRQRGCRSSSLFASGTEIADMSRRPPARDVIHYAMCVSSAGTGRGMFSFNGSICGLTGFPQALAGPRTGNQYLAHVGGAGRLMELQGPMKCHDRFANDVLRFSRGGIVCSRTLTIRTHCSLCADYHVDIQTKTMLPDFAGMA